MFCFCCDRNALSADALENKVSVDKISAAQQDAFAWLQKQV
jgi:hypothetical protein